MLPRSKWMQFGNDGLDVKGIVVHNTGNDLSAQENYKYLFMTTNNNGCHFLIDDKEIMQVLPKTWRAWTSGKGNDWCYEHCIAIEICNCNTDDKYLMAQARAVAFIKDLLNEYGLNAENIHFHNDFNSEVYCPNKILDIYKSRLNWLEKEF